MVSVKGKNPSETMLPYFWISDKDSYLLIREMHIKATGSNTYVHRV